MAAREVHHFDVVVVGFGVAGLSAAVSAMQEGASVAILERAPADERGGNTRYTEAYLRMKDETEVAEDFEARLANNAGHYLDPSLVRTTADPYEDWPSIVKSLNFTDPELISAFAAHAGPTIQWLKSCGVHFDFLPTYFLTAAVPRMMPVGGGLAIVETLGAHAEKRGSVFYETTARRLRLDDEGAVVGLEAAGKGNRMLEFRAGAVVLACGGFEGNPEMMAQYLGPRARYLRPIARGGYYNKGEGIRMALQIGAAPSGDYGSFHAEPIDPRSGAAEPNVMIFSYGILVNKAGRRFCDEGADTVDSIYEPVTRQILEQPEGIAYAVLDGKIEDVPNWEKAVRSDQASESAGSLRELADKLGIDAEGLETAVAEFNQACPAAEGFRPLETDGVSTSGIRPVKSNWARPIDTPPFQAWPLTPANVFTFGGLKVNAKAQVLNCDGDSIPGLYAAGEVIGMYHGVYTGSTSVLRGAVFGRLAGRDAAQSTTGVASREQAR